MSVCRIFCASDTVLRTGHPQSRTVIHRSLVFQHRPFLLTRPRSPQNMIKSCQTEKWVCTLKRAFGSHNRKRKRGLTRRSCAVSLQSYVIVLLSCDCTSAIASAIPRSNQIKSDHFISLFSARTALTLPVPPFSKSHRDRIKQELVPVDHRC
jgi:hypothetical protein